MTEYKFRAAGVGGVGSVHCTYCPERPGDACTKTCARIYEQLQAERAKDGVIIIDEPESG